VIIMEDESQSEVPENSSDDEEEIDGSGSGSSSMSTESDDNDSEWALDQDKLRQELLNLEQLVFDFENEDLYHLETVIKA